MLSWHAHTGVCLGLSPSLSLPGTHKVNTNPAAFHSVHMARRMLLQGLLFPHPLWTLTGGTGQHRPTAGSPGEWLPDARRKPHPPRQSMHTCTAAHCSCHHLCLNEASNSQPISRSIWHIVTPYDQCFPRCAHVPHPQPGWVKIPQVRQGLGQDLARLQVLWPPHQMLVLRPTSYR